MVLSSLHASHRLLPPLVMALSPSPLTCPSGIIWYIPLPSPGSLNTGWDALAMENQRTSCFHIWISHTALHFPVYLFVFLTILQASYLLTFVSLVLNQGHETAGALNKKKSAEWMNIRRNEWMTERLRMTPGRAGEGRALLMTRQTPQAS